MLAEGEEGERNTGKEGDGVRNGVELNANGTRLKKAERKNEMLK